MAQLVRQFPSSARVPRDEEHLREGWSFDVTGSGRVGARERGLGNWVRMGKIPLVDHTQGRAFPSTPIARSPQIYLDTNVDDVLQKLISESSAAPRG
ncbi:hypothetical protein FA13DRAFT_1732193 [Coprinellus micaceus]|uniref:Uncharacterized protein n=1 Tax=Coprinellus micaceus TaxID=71717 RepID=A0A4Y7TD04_COPMI|nr:hypothetical protein FA13DRAFT_1732193 [Coprinellus micaceus]